MQNIVNSNSVIWTTSSLVTPLDSNFRYGVFINDSANVIYLSVWEDAVVGRWIRLNANWWSFEINNTNPIRWDINAIATLAGSNLSFVTIS